MRTRIIITTFIVSWIAMLILLAGSSAQEANDTKVFAGDSAGNLFALDAPSGSLRWSSSLGGDTRSVVVSDNGQFIVLGTSTTVALLSQDGQMLWNKTIGVNPTDPGPPYQFDTRLVSISDDGGHVIAAHNDGLIRLYDNKGVEVWNDVFSATSVALSGNGKRAVAGGSLGIRYYSVGSNGIWDSTDSVPIWTVTTENVRKVAISTTGSYVATGGNGDGYVRLYDETGTQIWSHVNLSDRIIVDISRDGTSVVAGNDDRGLSFGAQLAYFSIGIDGIWTAADGTPVWTFRASNGGADDVRAIAISTNGSCIASGGSGNYGSTFVHNTASPAPVYDATLGNEDETISISSEGRYVAAADTETAAVRLYDTTNVSAPLWTYNTTFSVRSVAIASPLKVANIWVPPAEGALFAGAASVGLTGGVSTMASALSDPAGFPFSGFARKINELFPETLKKWLHEFISSKRKLVIAPRTGSPFTLTKIEVLSYAVVLSTLTIAFSYAKSESLSEILSVMPTVLATSIIVEVVKNYSTEVLARKLGVWTEHRVWYLGLCTFLISTFAFRTPFSAPGRLTHHAPKFTKRSLGLVSSFSVFVALVFTAIFYTVLLNGFTLIGNIGLVMCLTGAFFETIPIPPMNGKDIYDWSKVLWLALFVTTFVLYIVCLLTL
jgi:WD40 repeat protein